MRDNHLDLFVGDIHSIQKGLVSFKGPIDTNRSRGILLSKLRSKLLEIEETPDDITGYADAQLLLLSFLNETGVEYPEVVGAIWDDPMADDAPNLQYARDAIDSIEAHPYDIRGYADVQMFLVRLANIYGFKYYQLFLAVRRRAEIATERPVGPDSEGDAGLYPACQEG